MPEYLAPGVYVEETSFRQKTIEGVSTSTAGFVGPARFGPVEGEPELLTSFIDFERIYGGIDPLEFDDVDTPNDLAHAVRGFFENGGRRLYVSRVYVGDDTAARASTVIGAGVSDTHPDLLIEARHPGVAGRTTVSFSVGAGQNILVTGNGGPSRLSGASAYDTVLVLDPINETAELYWLEEFFDTSQQLGTFRLRRPGEAAQSAPLVHTLTDRTVHVLTVTVTVGAMGRFMDERTWENLAPDPRHRIDPLPVTFAADPTRRATELFVPIVIGPDGGGDIGDGVTLLRALLAEAVAGSTPTSAADLIQQHLLPWPDSQPQSPQPLVFQVTLDSGGSDGDWPTQNSYAGDVDEENRKSGLLAFEDIEDIAIVAAPGSTRGGLTTRSTQAPAIQLAVISHCERMRYRVAVLDSPDGALVGEVREWRAAMDSTHASMYYPWITIVDPITRQEMNTPPSGYMAGIYARNDVERGVHKSPANEVVRLAVDFEYLLNKAQQDVLNPENINCLRFFEGRGMRVWGARCITSDPEWRYLAVRRFFAYLEHSIDVGTQWAVFEPNGRTLWNRVRRTIEDFLFNEWRSGHLMGATPAEAFFVKCDRTTMTQSDFDNGRLICLIGVAPLRPAEFVIFRIGQKVLESRN